jgi:hypothetical protein
MSEKELNQLAELLEKKIAQFQDSDKYKDLYAEKFRGLHIQIQTEFSTVHSRLNKQDEKLDKIETQVLKTNGRVTDIEKREITHELTCPVLPKMNPLINKVQKDVDDLQKELTGYKAWKRFPKIAFAMVAIGLVMMIISFVNLKLNINQASADKETHVNQTEIQATQSDESQAIKLLTPKP